MRLSRQLTRFNQLCLILIMLVYAVDNYIRDVFGSSSHLNVIKNGILLGVIVIFCLEFVLVYLHGGSRKTVFFTRELLCVCIIAATFAFVSVIYMCINSGRNPMLYDGLLRLLLPIITAFFIVNLMSVKSINQMMIVGLVFMIFFYLMAYRDKLSLGNLLSIDWIASSSPFESHMFSPPAIAFCIWFCYWRTNKLLMVLSVLFSIMTFKRFILLFAIFICIFGGIIRKQGEAPRWVRPTIGILFLILSFFYVQLSFGVFDQQFVQLFGISTDEWMMGRQTRLNAILNSGFTSQGFQSSLISHVSCEMDLVQYVIEMGWVSVTVFVICMLVLAGRKWYCLCIVLFCLIECLTSHWMDITYFWILTYLTIGVIYRETSGIIPPNGSLAIEKMRL